MKKKGSKTRRKPQVYTEDFKWKVVKEVLSGELTQAEAKRKYNIGSNSAILYWTREFSGSDNPRESRLLFMQENKMSKKDNLTSDQERIKELEEALRKEKNKSFPYEKMMEVIEEDYGVVSTLWQLDLGGITGLIFQRFSSTHKRLEPLFIQQMQLKLYIVSSEK